ncbi:hypothetical protein [Rhodococcus sp. 14-2470-1a]|uniref:hypothetical protein n=1 Tax=Rhodococcus sp. 14-2470-1a TaxID=2023150 RepID=UPI000B9C18BB|nr:hypothetical protein [Rhodococcus sp. 14-2470-1a]OZF55402.1 hypothetical protein CH292_05430 [Rhodococcus sp. 14-2470-1a]
MPRSSVDRRFSLDRQPSIAVTPLPAPRPEIRFADVAVVASVCAAAAMLPLPGVVRAVFLAVLIFVGPGATILTWVYVPPRARFAAVPVLSLALMTLVTTGAMWGYQWNPRWITALVALLQIGSSLLWYRKYRAWPDASGWSTWLRRLVDRRQLGEHATTLVGRVWDREYLRRNVAGLMLALALVLWLPSLPGLEKAGYSQFGLLTAGTGPVLVVCMALVVGAFLLAVKRHQFRSAVAAVAVAIIVQRLTVTLVTDAPVYEWTYKHVAVTEYILSFGSLPPNGIDIYAQWPSFFVVTAWFSDVTGYGIMSLAHVFAPLVHVLIAFFVYALARVLKLKPRTAVTAAMLAELVNWVGQDYYAPQSLGFVLAIGFLVLLMASTQLRVAGFLALVPFAALVPTHQLTPYWLFAVAGVLLVTRRAKPWWLMFPLALILIGYLIPRLDIVAPYGLLSGFDPVENAASNVQTPGILGKQVTSLICRALSAGVFGLAMISIVYAWRTKKPFWAPMVMAFGSIGLLAGQSYGGEAIFRVYLYAIPGCVLLIAPMLIAALDADVAGARSTVRMVSTRVAVACAFAGTVGAATFGLQGYFGLWPLVVENKSQVDNTQALVANSPAGSKFTMLYPAGYPIRSTAKYVEQAEANEMFDAPLNYYGPEYMLEFPTPDQLEAFEWEASQQGAPSYVILTRQSLEAMNYYGFMKNGAPEAFERWLRSNPAWSLHYQDANTIVFERRNI